MLKIELCSFFRCNLSITIVSLYIGTYRRTNHNKPINYYNSSEKYEKIIKIL